jgi:hypothetical protein
MSLARYQRIEGWVPEGVLRAQFAAVSALAAAVPVHLMKVPWGPPFGETVAADVLTELQLPAGPH